MIHHVSSHGALGAERSRGLEECRMEHSLFKREVNYYWSVAQLGCEDMGAN